LATAVHVERTTLSDDNHAVVHDDGGETIHLVYDPQQITEAAALAWLCVRTPRLISEGLRILR
jgi:hypothetical protein